MNDAEPFQLNLTEKAKHDLARLDKPIATRIMKKLFELADNALLVNHHALTGQWKGLYRLRIGDYRVIYDLDHENRLVVIVVIGHRSDIYDY